MPARVIVRIAEFVRKVFYTFLDIMGILLGLFLMASGYWISSGHSVSGGFGGLVLAIGIGAFIIHTGHYFNLKITRWIFGSGTFFHRDERRA